MWTTAAKATYTQGFPPTRCVVHIKNHDPLTFDVLMTWVPEQRNANRTYSWLQAVIGPNGVDGDYSFDYGNRGLEGGARVALRGRVREARAEVHRADQPEVRRCSRPEGSTGGGAGELPRRRTGSAAAPRAPACAPRRSATPARPRASADCRRSGRGRRRARRPRRRRPAPRGAPASALKVCARSQARKAAAFHPRTTLSAPVVVVCRVSSRKSDPSSCTSSVSAPVAGSAIHERTRSTASRAKVSSRRPSA